MFFSFLLCFCNHFHKDGLHLSHAQMHNTVVLLLYWQESGADIYISGIAPPFHPLVTPLNGIVVFET